MTDPDVPIDLTALEQRLRGGPAARAALRPRVMARVQDELNRSRRVEFWYYAAGVGASVLLLLNVSLSACMSPPQPTIDPASLAAINQQVSQMQLGLSPAEVKRQ
jgi:hypothetical protein